jgi:hypothetical protein
MIVENKNITKDSKKVKSLISKLAYMYKAGTEQGEKYSAKKKLDNICMKYGIPYEEVDYLESSTRSFRYVNSESKLILSHCIWSVVCDAKITSESSTRQLFVILTLSQQIEVSEQYNYYWKLYKNKREKFTSNFILKNDIGVIKTELKKIA